LSVCLSVSHRPKLFYLPTQHFRSCTFFPAAMGAALSYCSDIILDERGNLRQPGVPLPQSESVRKGEGEDGEQGPLLALRISYSPSEASSGSMSCPFAEGDEVAVASVEAVRTWEALGAYQDRVADQRARRAPSGKVPLPEGPRQEAQILFYRARIIASNGKGGFEEHVCLLQIAASRSSRTASNARHIVDDASQAASYAHRFNLQNIAALGQEIDPRDIPGIKVAPAVSCVVLGTAAPRLAQEHDHLTLTLCPIDSIQKFVFDGSERFLELPQTYFHYVAWTSGGSDIVADVQGQEDDDGNFLLVNPIIIRAPKATIGTLLGAATGMTEVKNVAETAAERFNTWHPSCGPLCKHFDPTRQGAHAVRRHCGLGSPGCGL